MTEITKNKVMRCWKLEIFITLAPEVKGRPSKECFNNRQDFLTPDRGGRRLRTGQGFCFLVGNKTTAKSNSRLQLWDVAKEPSAAQRKEARYHGGRFSKSLFPDLQTRCYVGTFDADQSVTQRKYGRRRTFCPLILNTYRTVLQ